MAYFDFSALIEQYSRPFTVITEGKGALNGAGVYVKGAPAKTELTGAIIGYSQNKVHRSEGNLTAMDKALHLLAPIDNALIGATVIFDGNKYKIETQKGESNAEFTGVYSYTLKHISAFKEVAE